MLNKKLIKIKLIENDLTIKKAAKDVNISINTLSKWANGKNLNQIEKFIELMNYLKIDFRELKKG